MNSIPYGRQDISSEDIEAVVRVLSSDLITQGPIVPLFESEVSSICKALNAVAFNSATSALHAACLALGLTRGDRLWTVPNTFVASANCGLYCGAEVDFIDIDPQTYNLSVEKLERKLAQAEKKGQLPSIVVAVHFAGQPTEQAAIFELGQKYGFRIIEDASHSIGSSRFAEPTGSCRWSDIVVFSFHPVKIITAGEGGMALCNDEAIAKRLRLFQSHGITRDHAMMEAASPPAWYYEQQELGFNYRMTDVLAALGRSQLSRLGDFVSRRNEQAQHYNEALAELPLQLPTVGEGNYSSFHLYVVRLKTALIKKTHRDIFEELRNLGIGVNLHYWPVYLQPYYRAIGFTPGLCPEAESYANEALTLPLYPALAEEQIEKVIRALNEVII